MTTSLEVKNYIPLRFNTHKNLPPKDLPLNQPLQPKSDHHNTQENTNKLLYQIKKNTEPQPIPRSESRNKTMVVQETTKTRNIHDDYILILENMDKRIRELMRQAAGLMHVVLQHQDSLKFDEKTQEKVRLIDDYNIQKEYRTLKDKLNEARRLAIAQGTPNKKYTPYFTVNNPQNLLEKVKKFTFNRVINLRTDPHPHNTRSQSASKKNDPNNPKQRASLSRQKNLRPEGENGISLSFITNYDHQVKRAEHYKIKASKLEAAFEAFLGQKEATDRINEQMAAQIVKLRAQTLNLKYQYQKHN